MPWLAFSLLLLNACSTAPRAQRSADRAGVPRVETREDRKGSAVEHSRGLASWYGKRFQGRRTASGERFNMNAMTAAHRTLPMGSKVRVTELRSGKSVTVRINDRGPFKARRIIDVSYAAARELGIVASGVAQVELRLLPNEG